MVKETKIIQIRNSKGIRIPKNLLMKYKLEGEVILEEHEQGLLIHSKENKKLSWEETYKAMQTANEDWTDWHNLEDNWDNLD